MNTITPDRLADMTITMLERTAMVLAEPAGDADAHPAPTRFARIAYSGPARGILTLGATEGFLRELAASLLGVETSEVDPDVHGSDALREMANIVGGSVILALSGERCEFSLGLPELVPTGEVAGATATISCTVVAEGGPLRVTWGELEPARAAA